MLVSVDQMMVTVWHQAESQALAESSVQLSPRLAEHAEGEARTAAWVQTEHDALHALNAVCAELLHQLLCCLGLLGAADP